MKGEENMKNIEQMISKDAYKISLGNKSPQLHGLLFSDGVWHHVTDSSRALSWRPKTPLSAGAYRLDQVGCPQAEGIKAPDFARVNLRLVGEHGIKLPTPPIAGISIKGACIGLPMGAADSMLLISPDAFGDYPGHIILDGAYLPPEWLRCGIWERHAGYPRTYPVTVALEIEGIEIQYCVMPMIK